MNINLDDDIKQSRNRQIRDKDAPKMSQLILIIILGVVIANMLSWGVQRGIE